MPKPKKYVQIAYSYKQLRQFIPRLSERDADFLRRAYDLAKQAHQGQTREARTPFFNHPSRVAALTIQVGKLHDVTSVAAALLHDAVENTKLTFEEIQVELSTRVADMVFILTKPWKGMKGKTKDNGGYIQRIAQSNDSCRVIKLCDRLDNTLSLPYNKSKDAETYLLESLKNHVQIIGRSSQNKNVVYLRTVLIEACLDTMKSHP